jgi:hypothetical protein
MNDKLITAAVVFLGIIALAVGAKLGVNEGYLAAGGSVLLLLAGSLRSMLPEKKP